MKKFGTPNGAAPGSEKENVGFAAVGTPPGVRSVLGAGGFGEAPPLGCGVVVLGGPVKPELFWLDGLLFLPPPCLAWPPPFDDCWEPPELLGAADCVLEPVEGVVGAGPGVGAGEEQDSLTPTIGAFTGNDSAETGVPAGALTVNVSFWPPTTVTVTTH